MKTTVDWKLFRWFALQVLLDCSSLCGCTKRATGASATGARTRKCFVKSQCGIGVQPLHAKPAFVLTEQNQISSNSFVCLNHLISCFQIRRVGLSEGGGHLKGMWNPWGLIALNYWSARLPSAAGVDDQRPVWLFCSVVSAASRQSWHQFISFQ